MLEILSQPEARKIIADNLGEKPEVFALKFRSAQFPVAVLATQLKYLQRSKDKLPSFYKVQAIVPPLSYEQCSSEATADLKEISGESVLDLTAGLGVDTLYFAKKAKKVVSVEKNTDLQAITKYNFSLLGIENVEFVNESAEDFIENYKGLPFDWIFIDPARRDEKGGKVFLPEDLQPNVLTLLPKIEAKCRHLMVKMSPLYDMLAAIKAFPNVGELSVVSVENECKELLLIWDFSNKKISNPSEVVFNIIIHNKQNTRNFVFLPNEIQNVTARDISEVKYLYEPDVAFYKSRLNLALFSKYYADFPISMTDAQGFFFSDKLISDFPGRVFRIKTKISYKPKIMIEFLKQNQINNANVLQRNFPHSVMEIRKSLKLKEGGNNFLICTTLNKQEKVIFWAEREY